MTVKVYRVNRAGERHPVGVPVEVTTEPDEGTTLPESLAYPPCACHQCRTTEVRHD